MPQTTLNIALTTDEERGIKIALRLEAARRGITMSELARHALMLGATQILEVHPGQPLPKDEDNGQN